jgi:hypothetical protein
VKLELNWHSCRWSRCDTRHGPLGRTSQAHFQHSFAQLLLRWSLAAPHDQWRLQASEHCRCGSEASRVHNWLDCSLHNRGAVRTCPSGIGHASMASITHTDAGSNLRYCYCWLPVVHHAPLVRPWVCCVKGAQSHAGTSAQPYEPCCIWCWLVCLGSGREFYCQGSCLSRNTSQVIDREERFHAGCSLAMSFMPSLAAR